MSVYIPLKDRRAKPIKSTKYITPKKPNKYADKELLQRMKALNGQPNVTRDKRALIKEFNPLHFALGEVRPVWKTYQSYAQNMGLLENEDTYHEPAQTV